MKDDKEIKLRLTTNHNYFMRTVIVEGCMQVILLCVLGFIGGMCLSSNTNASQAFFAVVAFLYVVLTFARIHKIVMLNAKITEYEDSVVKDTIHSVNN